MRRLAALLAVAAVTVAGPAACGGDNPKPLTPLDDALGYFARDAPLVAAVETDPDGDQVKQVQSLLGRFPVGGVISRRLEQLSPFDFLNFDRDVRPQLGNPLVIGLIRPAAGRGIGSVTVAAIRVKDPTKVKQVVLRQPGFFGRGKASGVRVYENKNDSRYVAVDGDVLVGATDRDMLEQALAMHRSDNRMREASFERDLVGLPDGAYVRVSGDPRTMIGADARMRPALTVKWLSSMRRLGATLKLHDDGVALDFRIPTDAKSLTDADLPLSPSPGTIPLIGAKGEVQAGVRDPGRLARFALAVERAIAPRRVARAEGIEPSGVDLQQQLPRHLGDVGVVAIDPVTRAFAARARIQQPHDVETGLQALAPALPDIAAALGVPGVGLATPPAGERFYALARPNAKTVVFGVIGDSLVVASEARRAAGLASESTHSAPVPKASAAVTVDARELVGKVLADQLGGPAALAAPFLVSGLRDLSGWLTISRAALRGHFKLTIVK